MLLCAFVAVVGGAFFLGTAVYIERDRERAENYAPTGETPLCVVLAADWR